MYRGTESNAAFDRARQRPELSVPEWIWRARFTGLRLAILLTAALLLAGCLTDTDSPDACAYAVTQDLDAGRFDSALERLDSHRCRSAMTDHERELNRAAAYIGKAGYDLVDIVGVVLGLDRPGDDAPKALQILSALRGLGANQGGLRFLDRAAQAHGRMVEAFPGRLNEACRRENRDLLNDLQQDACFLSGLFAYARFARGIDLLLRNELDLWLSGAELDCDNDRNATGVPDQAEITACAIRATTEFNQGSGTCQSAGTRNGVSTGAVTWATLPAHPLLRFSEAGNVFAELTPIQVTVEAGGSCSGERTGIRLIQEEPPRRGVAISDGFCRVNTAQSCSQTDPDAGCWPCPIPRATGTGAITMSDAVLDSVNTVAEHLFGVVPSEELDKAEDQLRDIREELCSPLAGTADSCDRNADDTLRVNPPAIERYLRR